MFFKPRIFISSTLSENLSIRSQIESFFKSVGAETILYEKNLTPSINPMTYRKDILDADFIIFIIKNQYGARTETGISGTHEEWKIALENNIPKHVYIKLEKDERDAEELIKEIDDAMVSYHYFSNDKELLRRIKETTFTIAKEIMLKKVEETQLPKITVKKIAVKYDYDEAIKIIKIIDAMWSMQSKFDLIETTLFSEIMEPIKYERESKRWIFVNKKLEELLDEMLSIYNKFENHSKDYTDIGEYRAIKAPVIGEVTISRLSRSKYADLSIDDYERTVKEFFERYEEFKRYVKTMKLFVDTM